MTNSELWEIRVGDCRALLGEMPAASVQCVVTSPPYYGLRDYGVDGQLGLEGSLKEYVAGLVEVFRGVRRVLRDDGTVWLNLGDSYNGSGTKDTQVNSPKQMTNRGGKSQRGTNVSSLKPKDLMGIPWRVAFALQEDGWWLRRDIIWSKPNPMPESVTDRPTSSHEYMFLLTKSRSYYYDADAVRSPLKDSSISRLAQDVESQEGSARAHAEDKTNGTMKAVSRSTDKQRGHGRRHAGFNDRWDGMTREEQQAGGANLRSVWEIATHPYSEAHFATFPEKLVEPCIKAGSATGDTVLDPFSGAGTTGLVAARFGRRYIGIELNPEYAEMSRKRIADGVGVQSAETAESIGGSVQSRMSV